MVNGTLTQKFLCFKDQHKKGKQIKKQLLWPQNNNKCDPKERYKSPSKVLNWFWNSKYFLNFVKCSCKLKCSHFGKLKVSNTMNIDNISFNFEFLWVAQDFLWNKRSLNASTFDHFVILIRWASTERLFVTFVYTIHW